MLANFALQQAARYERLAGQRGKETSRLAFFYVSSVFVLQLADLFLTRIGLNSQHLEVNPLSVGVLHLSGFGGAVVEKVLFTILVVGVVLRMRHGRTLLMFGTVLFLLVTVASNILLLS